MEKYNIGITVGLINDFKALESNALLMNAFYLYDVIEKTKKYKPYIVICDVNDKKELINKSLNKSIITYYNKDYNYINFSLTNIHILDILASVFYDFTKKHYEIFSTTYPHMKFIHISYGNSYVIDISYYLYLENDNDELDLKEKKNNENDIFKNYEQIWISPHFEYSKSYFKVKFNISYDNLLIAPYVWNNRIQHIRNKEINYNFDNIAYDKIGINIGIFEANLHLIKNCMMPLYISEEFYNTSKYKEQLSSVHITSIIRMAKKQSFIRNIQSLELYNDKKLELQYNAVRMPHYLKQYNINLIICHQIYNGLNYLHFELASLGIPFLHNCEEIKEMGYYYKKFDISEAVKLIEYIYENHNPNNPNYDNYIKEYNERNAKIIFKYSTNNPLNINKTETYLNKLYN